MGVDPFRDRSSGVVGGEGGRGGAILLDVQFLCFCLATIFGVTKSAPLSKEAVGNSWDLL